MEKIEEMQAALSAGKAAIEMALERLDSIKDEEEEPVTLQLAYHNKAVPLASLCNLEGGTLYRREHDDLTWLVSMNREGVLANKAFALNEEYDWELGRDKDSRLCLVPIKKEKK